MEMKEFWKKEETDAPVVGGAPEEILRLFIDNTEVGNKTAKEIFADIFSEVERLRKDGNTEALKEYVHKIHSRYFSSSHDLFSQLSLKDSFEILLRVNKVDELQGPIGQSGVGQLVYRLASFQYEETDKSDEEIGGFINELLENKNVSETVEIFGQLQTVAAYALADGDWGYPVYNAIKKYFQTQKTGDIFILAKIKERMSESLLKEEETPTMSVVTTMGNRHKSLMFEENIFDEELNSKINNSLSFGRVGWVRISPISRDYLGIFDERNRLTSLASSKNIDLEEIKNVNDGDALIGIDNYYEVARSLRSRKHLFNKILDLSFAGILEVEKDDIVVSKFAELLEIKKEELIDYLENEKLYTSIQKSEKEVPDDIQQKSDNFFAILKKIVDLQKSIELEDSVYDLFNKKFEERKNKRRKVDTLDLAGGEDLGFLGLNKDNLELFRVLQDPYFTNAIQETFGVNLADLDVRAQVSFLSFFSKATKVDVEYFSHLISRFDAEDREKICTAYLSFEEESEFGYIIEKLCERPEIALPVISVVYELIGNAGKIEDFLLSEFKTGNERKAIASLYEKLINKAKKILLKYNAKVMNLESLEEIAYGTEMLAENTVFSEEDKDEIGNVGGIMTTYKNSERQLVEEARHELLNTNINQTLFLNAFKSLKEEGFLVPIEDISGVELVSCSPEEISAKDREIMRSIYSRNQKESVAHDILLENFEKRIKNPDTKFYIFKWQGEIKSFVIFSDEHKDGTLYMSGLNVSPDAKGYKIGDAMLGQVVEQEAKGNTLTAECESKLPISSKYIETGWIGNSYWGEEDENKKKSDWVLGIKRDETMNVLYWGKSQNKESIMDQKALPDGVKIEIAKTQAELQFHLCNEGYVLTRMFKDERGGLSYGVFEVPPKKETTQE